VAYCSAQGLEPRDDLTNYELRFRRNAVRHDLLPRLSDYNSRVAETLARNAALLADDADYLQQEAMARLAELRRPAPAHALALSLPAYAPLPVALRRRIVRHVVTEITGTTDGFRAEHIESIDILLLSGKAGRRWQLPRRLQVEVAGDLAIFACAPGQTERPQEGLPVVLPVPGSCQYGAWQITARLESGAPTALSEGAGFAQQHTIRCDRRALSGLLHVRARLPGDRLRPLGLDGSKKVQDLLVDRKVARQQRESIPIVCDDQGIFWVVGQAVDERVAVQPDADEVVLLRAFFSAEWRMGR
jgi:tRNA(Ile)-lysidine synthase